MIDNTGEGRPLVPPILPLTYDHPPLQVTRNSMPAALAQVAAEVTFVCGCCGGIKNAEMCIDSEMNEEVMMDNGQTQTPR